MDMDTSSDPVSDSNTVYADPASAAYWSQYYQQCYQQAGGYTYGGGYTDPWPAAAAPPPPPTQPPPPPPEEQPPPPPDAPTAKRSRKDDKNENKIKIKLAGASGLELSSSNTPAKSDLPPDLPPMPKLPGNLPPLPMLFGNGTMPSLPPKLPVPTLIPGMSNYTDSGDYPDYSSAPPADVKYESPSRNGGRDEHNNYNRRSSRNDESPTKGFSKRPPPPNDKRPPPPTERTWAQVAAQGSSVGAQSSMDYSSSYNSGNVKGLKSGVLGHRTLGKLGLFQDINILLRTRQGQYLSQNREV